MPTFKTCGCFRISQWFKSLNIDMAYILEYSKKMKKLRTLSICSIGNSGLNVLQCLNLAVSPTTYLLISCQHLMSVDINFKNNRRKAFIKLNSPRSKNNKIQSKYMWFWISYCFRVIHNPACEIFYFCCLYL